MKKVLFLLIATLTQAAPAFAAPAIDFTSLVPLATFNGAQNDTTSVGGVGIAGFVYNGGTSFDTTHGFLWLRNDSGDHGLGYCSEGTSCGATNTTGDGDFNELSNNNKDEIIRLTRPSGKSWSNIFVSSLDTGGSGSNEKGTLYWSNDALANLNNISTFTTFSHTSSGFGSSVEGSIFGLLSGFDANAQYLFFRAGPNTAGNNNDYLVWGVNTVNAIPEPEIYAMMGIGLVLMGFVARRKKLKEGTTD